MAAKKVELPASCDIAAKDEASAGNRKLITAAVAPEAQACPDGKPGCCGKAKTGTMVGSAIGGRNSSQVNLVSQQAIVASCCATASRAYTRAARGASLSR